ncbi:MAG: hypothetical protein PVTTEEND_001988 [Candidatus Fervidibacter sp.]
MRRTALLVVTLALVAIGVAQSGTDWVAEGQTAMKRGDYEKAVHAFLEALKERPDDGELRLQLGEALLLLKRAQEAAPHLVRALELLASHPRTPSETLQKICDLLMGRLRGASIRPMERFSPSCLPLAHLSEETCRSLLRFVPMEWLIKDRAEAARWALQGKEWQTGIALLMEVASEGQWEAANAILFWLPEAERQKVWKAIWSEAERTNKPEAWLLTLSLDWLIDAPTFRDVFFRAFKATQGNPNLLQRLGEIALRRRFEEGVKVVKEALSELWKRQGTPTPLFEALDKAIADGDLSTVRRLLLTLVAETPHLLPDFFSLPRLRAMVEQGWTDWLLQVLPLERLTTAHLEVLLEATWMTPAKLQQFLKPFKESWRWNEWRWSLEVWLTNKARQLIREGQPKQALELLEGWRDFLEPTTFLWWLQTAAAAQRVGRQDVAWENLKRVFPSLFRPQRGIDEQLFSLYWQQGMHSSSGLAVDVPTDLVQVVKELFSVAASLNRFDDLDRWLQSWRDELPLFCFALIAQQWYRWHQLEKALGWLEEMHRRVKEMGELDKAPIHAQMRLQVELQTSAGETMSEEMRAKRRQLVKTVGVFAPETFALWVRCLWEIGRKKEAERVLEWARKLYPQARLFQTLPPSVPMRAGLAELFPEEVVQKMLKPQAPTGRKPKALSEEEAFLKTLSPEEVLRLSAAKGSPKGLPVLLRMAQSLVRENRLGEAEAVAQRIWGDGAPMWQQGWRHAIGLFQWQPEKVVAFWRWLKVAFPKDAPFDRNLYAAMNIVVQSLQEMGEADLANFLAFVAGLQESHFLSLSPRQTFWERLTEKDLRALTDALLSEPIGLETFERLLIQLPHGVARNWAMQAMPRFVRSLRDYLRLLDRYAEQIPREHFPAWWTALEVADMGDIKAPYEVLQVLSEMLSVGQKLMMRRFREEVARFLEIALRRLPEWVRPEIAQRYAYWLQQMPPLPALSDSSPFWVAFAHAQALYFLNRRQETEATVQKAWERAQTPDEKIAVLRLWVRLNPDVAFRQGMALVQQIAESGSGKGSLASKNLAIFFYELAEQRKEFAPQIRPLFDRYWTTDLRARARLRLLTGDADDALRLLTNSLNATTHDHEKSQALHDFLAIALHIDTPSEVAEKLLSHLRDWLLRERPSIELVAVTLQSAIAGVSLVRRDGMERPDLVPERMARFVAALKEWLAVIVERKPALLSFFPSDLPPLKVLLHVALDRWTLFRASPSLQAPWWSLVTDITEKSVQMHGEKVTKEWLIEWLRKKEAIGRAEKAPLLPVRRLLEQLEKGDKAATKR